VSEGFSNYFNYFTEIEEHFQQARGTGLFLLSPLDWALIETWKNSNVPLQAVLRGIDIAFEKWQAKRSRFQQVNGLAYCAQAVMLEAQRMADSGSMEARAPERAPFAGGQIDAFLAANALAVRAHPAEGFAAIADALDAIRASLPGEPTDLEGLEQQLTALEQKMVALARVRQPDDQALAARQELDSYLRPYRSKMTAPQIAMLENQFLDRKLMEAAQLPRLSLFYMGH
jgi:hypothetical protein